MGYKDLDKKREAARRWYRNKYSRESFRQAEADRKAEWYQQAKVKRERSRKLREWREAQAAQDLQAMLRKLAG